MNPEKHIELLNQALKTLDTYEEGLLVVGVPHGDGPYNGYELSNTKGEKIYKPWLLSEAAQKLKNSTEL